MAPITSLTLAAGAFQLVVVDNQNSSGHAVHNKYLTVSIDANLEALLRVTPDISATGFNFEAATNVPADTTGYVTFQVNFGADPATGALPVTVTASRPVITALSFET